jgi:zinc/manganese transport system substrate-binding protein
MKKLSFILLMLGLLFAAPVSAFAKVDVFACAPEWGELAKEIGGDKVDVYTASNANQDIHHMRAKPSLLAAMRQADLVVCSGASLEIGWLPILLSKAGSASVQDGGIGSIMAADYVPLLDVMETADRSMGHVHPEGNPHVHLDPNNILIVSKVIAERLSEIDINHASAYQNNQRLFEESWRSAMTDWEKRAANLKGMNIVVYHKSWTYLLNWLGINSVASLEPKPGIPPNAAHLADVLKSIQGKNVKGILVAPFESDKGAKWLSEKANVPVIKLPFTVGGNDQSENLQSMFDNTLDQLTRN